MGLYIEIPARVRPLATDKRVRDADGRMHVADCVLTAAQVNPYLGREVPGFEALGLEPERLYYVYREAGALKAAVDAGLFENLPLMLDHVGVSAADPQKQLIAGSISNARWQSGKVIGDLAIWDQQAIDLVESGEQRELSCGYRYTAVPQSGVINGERYDLSMRDIVPNHCALVSEGGVEGATVHDRALRRRPTLLTVDVRVAKSQLFPRGLDRLP